MTPESLDLKGMRMQSLSGIDQILLLRCTKMKMQPKFVQGRQVLENMSSTVVQEVVVILAAHEESR